MGPGSGSGGYPSFASLQAKAKAKKSAQLQQHARAKRAKLQQVKRQSTEYAGAAILMQQMPSSKPTVSLFGTSRFYLGAVLCVPAALLPDMALQALQRLVAPRDFQVVQEMVWKSIVEGPAARAAKAAAKDTEGGGEAKDGVAQAGAFVGGVEGVTRERAHTGYAFEHPGFEGASTIALYTNDNDNGMQKAKPRASDVLEQKAGIAEKKRRSSQLG